MENYQKIRQELESSGLDATISRVSALVMSTEDPKAIHLGILLALRIAEEMRAGNAPGTTTATIVANWMERYGEERVNQAVEFARHFLFKPEELMHQIAARLDAAQGGESTLDDEKALAERYAQEDAEEMSSSCCCGGGCHHHDADEDHECDCDGGCHCHEESEDEDCDGECGDDCSCARGEPCQCKDKKDPDHP
ncbi:MAG TPA: hypothetical protein VLM37_10295 [Fibrobacteraceae bacterium]|nr:hypothetical protein [Fibrobacteraceae bacterium]